MAAIDWTSADPTHLAMLVRVDYLGADGEAAVARWCGPPEVCTGGIVATVDGERAYYAPRLSDAEVDGDLGPLKNHTQSPSEIDLTVNVGPTVDYHGDATAGTPLADDIAKAAAFMLDVQKGRWENRRIQAWWVTLDDYGAVSGHEPAFDGVTDRGPNSVKDTTFRIRGTDALAGLDSKLPGEQFPPLKYPYSSGDWSHDDATLVGPLGGPHAFHPGTGANGYQLMPDRQGAFVGPVFGVKGGGTAADDQYIWTELPIYGSNGWPAVANHTSYFLFVSPMHNCYVHQVAWEDNNALTVAIADEIDTSVLSTYVETFNNFNREYGPVGTCAALRVDDTYLTDPFGEAPTRFYGKVSGPGRGGLLDTVEGGIQRLRDYGGNPVVSDFEIIEALFTDPRGLDLGPSSQVFGANALSDFASHAPVGDSTGDYRWRNFHCRVPREPEIGTGPDFREVLGELLSTVQGDLVRKVDPTVNEMRLYPIRRRPNPATTHLDPQHRVYGHDLLEGHGGGVQKWVRNDDPDGYYSNSFKLVGPKYFTRALQAAVDGVDELDPERQDISRYEEPAEQGPSGANRFVHKGQVNRYWVHNETPSEETFLPVGGLTDAATLIGTSRAQPIHEVEIEMGLKGYAINLGDTVEYHIPGLHVGIGQVRGALRRLRSASVRLRTHHLTFMAGASAAKPGEDVHED